jgi:hypothetical protein
MGEDGPVRDDGHHVRVALKQGAHDSIREPCGSGIDALEVSLRHRPGLPQNVVTLPDISPLPNDDDDVFSISGGGLGTPTARSQQSDRNQQPDRDERFQL